MIQDAWGWCTGMTQRDGIGREEGGGVQDGDFRFSLSCIGEGNGNPFRCSCLENPRDAQVSEKV